MKHNIYIRILCNANDEHYTHLPCVKRILSTTQFHLIDYSMALMKTLIYV